MSTPTPFHDRLADAMAKTTIDLARRGRYTGLLDSEETPGLRIWLESADLAEVVELFLDLASRANDELLRRGGRP